MIKIVLSNHRAKQPIRDGSGTGPGWYALIDQLCADLRAAIDSGSAPQI